MTFQRLHKNGSACVDGVTSHPFCKGLGEKAYVQLQIKILDAIDKRDFFAYANLQT